MLHTCSPAATMSSSPGGLCILQEATVTVLCMATAWGKTRIPPGPYILDSIHKHLSFSKSSICCAVFPEAQTRKMCPNACGKLINGH